MAKEHETVNLEEALQDRFDRWDEIFKNGASDPFWADGVNLSFVRNHILYYKSEMEKRIGDGEYPEIYYRDTPPEIEQSYMARADEIRENAAKTLRELETNQNIEFIKRKVYSMDKEFVSKTAATSDIPRRSAYYQNIFLQ